MGPCGNHALGGTRLGAFAEGPPLGARGLEPDGAGRLRGEALLLWGCHEHLLRSPAQSQGRRAAAWLPPPCLLLGPEPRQRPAHPGDLALPGTEPFLDLLKLSRGPSRKAPLLQSAFFQGPSSSEIIQMSD